MSRNSKFFLIALGGFIAGLAIAILLGQAVHKTSTNEYCMSCHHHPHAETSWKQSVHYNNESGVMTDCAACHLPPEGTMDYYLAKAKTGMKDVWVSLTKDPEEIDWDSKGNLEHAVKIVYNESCKACHVNLFPSGISDEGIIAHMYYEDNEEKLDLQCIS